MPQGKEVFGGRLRLGAIPQIKDVFYDWGVSRDGSRIGNQWEEIYPVTARELTQCIEDLGVIGSRHF